MADIVIPQRFAQKRDTTANWEAKNPVLWSGEIGLVMDPGQAIRLKVGDGTTKWKDLAFFASNGKELELQRGTTHIQWRLKGDTTWIDLVALSSLKGDKGDTGASNYQLAQSEGFVGSLSEWLTSLKGDKGDTGSPGIAYQKRIQVVTDTNSGTLACDWDAFDEIRVTLTSSVALTFSGARDGQACLIKLRQDSTGGRSVSFPAGVRFNSLITSYAVSTGPGKADKIGFIYDGEDSKYDLVSIIPGL